MTVTQRHRILYIVSDYIMCNIGWLLFNIVRYFSLPPGIEPRLLGEWLFHDTNILLGQFFYPLVMVALYAVSGFYNRPGIKSRIDQLGNSAFISLVGMLFIFFTALINDNVPERLHNYELMAILWLLLCGPTLLCRIIINNSFIRERVRRGGIYNAIIVGNESETKKLAAKISNAKRGSDFKIAGFAHANSDSIDSAIITYNPQVIIVGASHRNLADDHNLLAKLFSTGLDIYVPLDLYHLISANPRVRSVASEPLINITRSNIAPSTVNLKRIGDIAVSIVALLALSPLMAFISLAIKRDSRGSVFYRQERVGYRKKTFNIIKFRTMITDAEPQGPALSSGDADPRITRIGRTLRKYRLDELPQFWNVLKGEMSLVGPRPEREFFGNQIARRAPHYNLIHQVRPGITSWGMVKFGYAANVDQMIERLRYDILYLENVSLSVDLKILFYTVNTVLTGKGV